VQRYTENPVINWFQAAFPVNFQPDGFKHGLLIRFGRKLQATPFWAIG